MMDAATQMPPPPGPRRAALPVSGAPIAAIIPTTMEQVWKLAEWIANAQWAPKSYKTGSEFDVFKISLGIMHGLELHLSPLAALQSIAIINGMPSVWGDGALAIVQSSGLLEEFKETPMVDGGAVIGYRCRAKRHGIPEHYEQEFTLEDAAKANLLTKDGPWQQYRKRMLQMRARAWVLRDGFADCLRGMHIAEEAMDMVDLNEAPQKTTEQRQQNRPRTAGDALDAFAGGDGPAPAALQHNPSETLEQVIPAAGDKAPVELATASNSAEDTQSQALAQTEAGAGTVADKGAQLAQALKDAADEEARARGFDKPGSVAKPAQEPVEDLFPPTKTTTASEPAVTEGKPKARQGTKTAPQAAPATFDDGSLPPMPESALEPFQKEGKWMPAWKWLSMAVAGVEPGAKAAFLAKHKDVLLAVQNHSDRYRKAVLDLYENNGVEHDL